MHMSLGVLAGCIALAFCATETGAVTPAAPRAEKLAPLPAVDIASTKIVLKNGLTLIVHEDHKAPIVAVNIWYHVGSKNEPAGRTGFAHLFEHLMFGGKNGNQKGWFERMEAMGATDLNGTTSPDRTNFFENVPTAALDTTLYLEAQRMGHLLDDFNETVLTTQRGVVQNEKRQGDNQPYAIAAELITKSVWPASHPYSHTVIGEMNDLDAAKIEDVKDWFAKYYGPSNAVIVLSGDITPAEAKAKVEKYFGAIPPGPPVARQKAWIAKRSGEQRAAAEDRVSLAKLYKVWNVPGYGAADADYLSLATDVLAWGKDSRLYKRLVYQDRIATNVVAYIDARELAGLVQVEVTAKPGVSHDRIEAALNEEMGKLLRDGPTADEIERAKTRELSTFIRGLERVGGFGGTSDILAQSEAFTGAPDDWKAQAERVRNATPAQVAAAMRRWLSDGVFTLAVTPFAGQAATASAAGAVPEVGAIKPPGFPAFRRAKLANGLNVVVVERHAAPTIAVSLILDAGRASDQFAKPGTAQLAADSLMDGTDKLDAIALNERIATLGVSMQPNVTGDFTRLSMLAFTTRIDPALDLFAEVVMHPGYRTEDVAREKALAIASIQQTKDSPANTAIRILPALVYGPAHAYGQLTTEASVAALTPQDLRAYHDVWFQPEGATLVIAGDTTLAEMLPKIAARFAGWKAGKPPAKNLAAMATESAVYLIDKPGTPQSVILAGETAPPRVNTDDIAIRALNAVLGGMFTSRLNMNLREAKHWSYGAASFVRDARGPGMFAGYASVQTDKTADSFVEMRKEFGDIVAARPVSAEELTLAKNDMTRSLPGRWETTWSLLGSAAEVVGYGLPDDYYGTYAGRVQALTTADTARAAHNVVKPQALTWVIVGDRAKVEAKFKALGLELRFIDADGKPVK